MTIMPRIRLRPEDMGKILHPETVGKVLDAVRGIGGLFATGYLTYSLGKSLGRWIYGKFDALNVVDNYNKLIQLDPKLKQHSNKVLQALQYIARTKPELLLDLPMLHRAVLAFIQRPFGAEFVSIVANYRSTSSLPIEVALT